MIQELNLARDKALAEAVRHHGDLFARAVNEAEAAGLDVQFAFELLSGIGCTRVCRCGVSRHTEL